MRLNTIKPAKFKLDPLNNDPAAGEGVRPNQERPGHQTHDARQQLADRQHEVRPGDAAGRVGPPGPNCNHLIP